MLLIRQFPGPNAALLWLLARHAWRNAAWIGAGCMAIGFVHGAYPDSGDLLLDRDARYYGPFLWFWIMAMTLSLRDSTLLSIWSPTYCPMPVAHRRLVRIDFLYYSLLPVVGCASYLAGFWIAARIALPPTDVTGALLALFIHTLSLPITAALRKAYGSLSAFPMEVLLLALALRIGREALSGSLAVSTPALFIGVLAAGCVSYTSLRLLGPRAARRDEARNDIDTTTAMAPGREEQYRPRAPFRSRNAAQRWLNLHRLERMIINPAYSVQLVVFFVVLLFMFELLDFQAAFAPPFMLWLGMVYLFFLGYVEGSGGISALPYTSWARMLEHCRVLGWGLWGISIAGAVFLAAWQLRNGGISWGMFLWLPWIAWASVAMFPLVLPSLVVLLLLPGEISEGVIALISVAYLAALPVRAGLREGGDCRSELGPLIVPLGLLGVALGAVHLLALPPPAHWIARDILGAAAVLAMLRYNVATHRMPAAAARRIAALLAVCTAAAVALVAIFGPPAAPPDAAVLFLGLGVVAPVFLPLAWIPLAIAWAGSGSGRPTRDFASDTARAREWDEF